MTRIAMACVLLTVSAATWGTTWDEPWMEEVIRDAESLVKVKVLQSDGGQFKARVIKPLAGAKTPDEITVNGFSLLDFGSVFMGETGETSMRFNTDLTYYLFIRKGKKDGEYLIATPTTGWAKIIEEGVVATYRHSYHQALLSEEVYELTMPAIFAAIHAQKFDDAKVRKFMIEQLSQEPVLLEHAEGNKDVMAKFFLQHAALETFRYLGEEKDIKLIDPFLKADDFHVQVSAVRAIGRIRSDAAKKRLMDFIEADRSGFAKVTAVWALEDLDAKEMRDRLKKFVDEGKDEETGFGGNLMDPRVGTRFPGSVKSAVKELLAVWSEDPAARVEHRTRRMPAKAKEGKE